MLRRIFVQISRIVKKMESVAEALPAALKGDSDGEPAKKKAKRDVTPPMSGRLDRKRKVALLLAYCGEGYYGIQRNPGFPTIEEELIQALLKTELIPKEHADMPQKMSFNRASRTDKGVSAAGNVISLKMLLNKENIPQEINKHLPPQIRVFAYKRGTRGFDSQHHCSHRTYTYMLPTYSFAPFEKFVTEAYRVDDDTIKQVGEILAMFQGTHNFHNYTSGVKPNDPSAKRYIITFECSKPFVRDGIEFSTLTVKGQSFMMHHIRKMIGLTTAIVKGYCSKEVIENSWQPKRLDIPKAPGVGLFLEQLHFNGYNKKFGVDGMHEPMEWDEYKEEIEKFKEEYIIKHIVRSEKEEKIMLRWLGTLQYHKFDTELEEDEQSWTRTKVILRKSEKLKKAAEMAKEKEEESSVCDNNSEKADMTEQNESSMAGSDNKDAETDISDSLQQKDSVINTTPQETDTKLDKDDLQEQSHKLSSPSNESSVNKEKEDLQEQSQKLSTLDESSVNNMDEDLQEQSSKLSALDESSVTKKVGNVQECSDSAGSLKTNNSNKLTEVTEKSDEQRASIKS